MVDSLQPSDSLPREVSACGGCEPAADVIESVPTPARSPDASGESRPRERGEDVKRPRRSIPREKHESNQASSSETSSSSKTILTPHEKKMIEEYWPSDIFAGREPTYIEDPAEFLRVLLVDEYITDVVILPDGCEKLDIPYEESFPDAIQGAFDASSSVKEFLEKMLNVPNIARYKGRCQYLEKRDGLHHQTEVRRGDGCLKTKIENVLKHCEKLSKTDIDRLYISELRLSKEEPHHFRKFEKTKSIMMKGIKDVLGQCAPYTTYWDRYDEGVFVGGPGSGKSFHVDQMLWSNVGKNYKGYKLLAAWGKDKAKLCEKYLDVLFTPPLSSADEEMLRSAAKVVLIRPGDVYFFTGGVPHVTLSIGEGLNLATYESYVSLNRRAIQFFMMGSQEYMGTAVPLYPEALMPECEFEDVKDEIVDNMQDLSHIILGNRPYITPSVGPRVDEIWKRLDTLIPELRTMFIEAVNIMCRDFYFRKELPRRVFEAMYFIEEEDSPSPLAKRPKLDTKLCDGEKLS